MKRLMMSKKYIQKQMDIISNIGRSAGSALTVNGINEDKDGKE